MHARSVRKRNRSRPQKKNVDLLLKLINKCLALRVIILYCFEQGAIWNFSGRKWQESWLSALHAWCYVLRYVRNGWVCPHICDEKQGKGKNVNLLSASKILNITSRNQTIITENLELKEPQYWRDLWAIQSSLKYIQLHRIVVCRENLPFPQKNASSKYYQLCNILRMAKAIKMNQMH